MKSKTDNPMQQRRRRRKIAAWSLLAMLFAVLLAPVSGYFLAGTATAQSSQEANERSNFWRAVREGSAGYSAVSGQESNVLIQNGGENWRTLRNGPLKTYGSWILAAVLLVIAFYHVIFGQIKIHRGRSGMTIQRWSLFERVLHWYTAILFIILAITGLSLLYGRAVMIPMLGKDAFAAYAEFGKNVHNYLGPFFAAGLLVEIIIWIKYNMPKAVDFAWLAKGGGLFSKSHPSAGRMNAGEKIWFWLLCTAGIALIVTGFILNFPNFGQYRETMQLSHLLHVIFGIVLLAAAFGHVYIGTAGSEGSIQGMVTGRVDTEWAKQHHDIWYEEMIAKGNSLEKAEQQIPTDAQPRST